MAAKDKADQQAKDKAKRTVLTPAERIAKLEEQLKAAREKAHDKDRKIVADLSAKRKVAGDKASKLADEINQLDREIAEAQGRIAGPVTDGVGEAPEGAES